MPFTEQQIQDGLETPVLGPGYYAARDMADRHLAHFEDEHMKPLVEAITEKIREAVWSDVSKFFLSDTESTLQSEIYCIVDSTVEALVGGEEWALRRYALGDNLRSEKIRAALVALIPTELQEKRIVDLEKENHQLRESLRYRSGY